MDSTGSNSSAPAPEAPAPAPAADAPPARADVVVALTSYNDARTIGAVAGAVRDGLARYFGSTDALILLADAHSNDGTREAARAALGADGLVELEPPVVAGFAEMPYHGYPGRAGALRAIFQTAQGLGARACAVVDAGIETVEPEWIDRLVAPVLTDDYDYVSPYYLRRPSDGALTKGVVYPMVRALYGARLRQPAAAEFGCSGRLIARFLTEDFWDGERVEEGIDLWLAIAAVCGGFRTCEAPLGVRVAPHETPVDLSTALAQVVGALFTDLERRVELWQRTRGSTAIPLAGAVPEIELEPSAIGVDGLIESFRLGYRELREIWTWILPPRTIVELRKLTEMPADRFRIDDRFWASLIYDFALGHGMRVMPQAHLLRSLTPLYSGWLASFVNQAGTAALPQVEERVEQVCRAFEAEKRHLIARWRWPERLRK
jgi:hypothetical protein